MANLGWLRSRIWLALALPMGVGCKKSEDRDTAPPPRTDAAVMVRAVDAQPLDAQPLDAAPPAPLDAAAVTVSWTVKSMGCAGQSVCGPVALAAAWAKGTAMEDGCPAVIDVPAGGLERSIQGPVRFSVATTDQCCYRVPYKGDCRGRPYLDDDHAIVAAADPGTGPAAAWIAAGLDEHASIASFARATLELMAVGAPPALLAECQRAALDEIAHAQGCFEMAARHGCAVEPGPIEALAPRGGGLVAVARDTFVEGCVGETIGAAIAAAARDAAVDPEERALMTRIADDEARHAALAWQTVAWAISREPAAAAAVRAAADRARTDDATWREVIDPTLAALLS